jgi:hypothetical protein
MNAKVEQAFPNPHLIGDLGMTMRDWFASLALSESIREMNEAESYDLNDPAELAYAYADAMMRARVKTEKAA